ncbi:MAG: toxin-antitoxin system HicB family antitoxin [Ardenticatenaceae bacterium]
MTHKDFDYYMNLPYTIEIIHDTSDPLQPVWFAQVKELQGCMTEADTWEEINEMIHDAMAGWIDISLQKGLPIPEPQPVVENHARFTFGLPQSLHRHLVLAAQRDGVSLNQFVNVALSKAAAYIA